MYFIGKNIEVKQIYISPCGPLYSCIHCLTFSCSCVLLSKKIDDVIICCDDIKILKVAKSFGAKAMLTSRHHKNGTDRICEAYKKIGKKYEIVLDIQGDEPLISPIHIDKVIDYHRKNFNADIILPNLQVDAVNNTNIVKLVTNKFNEVLYISRANIPYEFRNRLKNKKTFINYFI